MILGTFHAGWTGKERLWKERRESTVRWANKIETLSLFSAGWGGGSVQQLHAFIIFL